jgi:hypothetical protein
LKESQLVRRNRRGRKHFFQDRGTNLIMPMGMLKTGLFCPLPLKLSTISLYERCSGPPIS